MGPEPLLNMACELSYVIARDGVESEPPVEAPPGMREYLYDAELAPEALDAAREAVDADPAFRRRVAEQASQDDVGRGGYIWLHRPIGWAAEYEELTGSQDETSQQSDDLELVPAIAELPDIGEVEDDNGSDVMAMVESAGVTEVESESGSASPNEADAIEDELTSLRGLVDRLANERKVVSSSVERVEQQLESARQQPSTFDSDIYTLQSELESAHHELETARREREQAVQQHSAALTRQLALEKELDRARELQAEIDRDHAESDTRLVEVQEALARAEAAIGPITAERDSLTEQIAELQATNNSLSIEFERLSDERRNSVESAEQQEARLGAEVDSLRIERTALEETLTATRSELDEMTEQYEATTTQAAEAKSLVDVLTEEKIEVASRLADTEVMLDNTRTQLGAVKSDLGAVSADLGTIKTHRDGLSSQVEELHGSLGEALGNLAKVRSISDADRASLKEVRTERDLLKVRLSSLEQVEAGLDAKLESMVSERDALLLKLEEAKAELSDSERRQREASEEKTNLDTELGQVQMANADLISVADQLRTEVEDLRSELVDAESSRDGLSQQVDQLTAENSAIQDQLVESDRLRVETSESQGHALSELAHRLAIVEDERSRLAIDLGNARKALERAQSSAQLSSSSSAAGALAPNPFSTAPTGTDEEGDAAADDPTAEITTDVDDGVLIDADADVDVDVDVDTDAEAGDDIEVDLDAAGDDDAVGDLSALIGFDDVDEPDDVDESDVQPPPVEEPVDSDDPNTDEEERSGFARATKRHSWSLGPLLRPGSRSKKSDDQPINGRDQGADEPDEAGADEELDDIAAALAEAAPTADDADALPEPQRDLHLGGASAKPTVDEEAAASSDEDDLDAIGDLISKAVTDFSPTESAMPPPPRISNDEPSVTDADADTSPSWTLLGSGKGAEAEDASDDPAESTPAGRGNGVLTPPSVFTDDADDPFASLDQFEAVTIRPESAIDADEQTEPGDFGLPGDADDGETDGADGSDADDVETQSDTPSRSRRQVEIPADLLDDDVELARHVVSSPDVVLLVDGDSVAKMGWPSLPVAQQRDALVSYLADLATSTGAAPDVVFDGRIGEEESLPASRAVRIRLSTPPTEPAAALDELVDAYPEQWPIAVVTDDDTLSSSAVERGAVVLNNGQLLDLFIAQ